MRSIFHNAKIYVDKGDYRQAVLVEDGIVVQVGSDADILPLAKAEDEVFDCGGRTLVPGFNDSHMHFMQLGETLNQAQIDGVRSIDEMIDVCRKFMADHPERVKNGLHAIGWNQDLFTDGDRLPDRHDLDKISTDIPIVLERVCGHIVSTNTKLIEMLGIDGNSPQYPNGEFLLGSDGYPNGIFKGNACNVAKDLIPDFTMEERREMILSTMKYVVSLGLTSIQSNDVGTTFMDGPAAFKLFHDIYDAGLGLLRYRHQVCFNDIDEFKKFLTIGEYRCGNYPEGSWLTLGPLKLFKDGSLGGRTGTMRQGYLDDPGNYGVETTTDADMDAFCQVAADAGIQVVTHVIGDKAIEDTITNYERVMPEGKNPLRHALVHCQITDRPLLERIVKDDILVMYQPIFLDYDMHAVISRCGEELSSTSYAFKTVEDLGGHVSYGTDSPVEDCNPFPNLYSAVTRKDKKGWPEGGFFPQECVDVPQAIDAYTAGSAYNEFREADKGRIKPGFLADLVVLDTDIFTCDPMKIRDILPVTTIVGGKVAWQKQ